MTHPYPNIERAREIYLLEDCSIECKYKKEVCENHKKIAQALDAAELRGAEREMEECAKVAEDDYVFGKDCPPDQLRGWRIGAEQACKSVAKAIRSRGER